MIRRIINWFRLRMMNRKAAHAGTTRAQPVTHRVVNRITNTVQSHTRNPNGSLAGCHLPTHKNMVTGRARPKAGEVV